MERKVRKILFLNELVFQQCFNIVFCRLYRMMAIGSFLEDLWKLLWHFRKLNFRLNTTAPEKHRKCWKWFGSAVLFRYLFADPLNFEIKGCHSGWPTFDAYS